MIPTPTGGVGAGPVWDLIDGNSQKVQRVLVDFHQGSRARERSSSTDRGSREVPFGDVTSDLLEPRFWTLDVAESLLR